MARHSRDVLDRAIFYFIHLSFPCLTTTACQRRLNPPVYCVMFCSCATIILGAVGSCSRPKCADFEGSQNECPDSFMGSTAPQSRSVYEEQQGQCDLTLTSAQPQASKCMLHKLVPRPRDHGSNARWPCGLFTICLCLEGTERCGWHAPGGSSVWRAPSLASGAASVSSVAAADPTKSPQCPLQVEKQSDFLQFALCTRVCSSPHTSRETTDGQGTTDGHAVALCAQGNMKYAADWLEAGPIFPHSNIPPRWCLSL